MVKSFKACASLVVLYAAFSFAQEPASSEEGIKFQIPTDESGAPAPVLTPVKPDTVQKLGLAKNMPLNLTVLSAKDTASFETYSKRYAVVQDSIAAVYRQMEHVRKNTHSYMPAFEPKGEFEKQAEFDARQSKWNMELGQRIEKDTKSLTVRLTELERAKTKIQENQASLYGSVEIKSNPAAVSIFIGREDIGTTPAEYNLLIPGDVKITMRKEGYIQWDTTFKVAPGAKLKLNVQLNEKSIFSQEGELDLNKLLSKDTIIQGYLDRVEVIKARKAQVAEELKQILADFSNKYPALEPQKADETPDAFNKRKEAWTREGMRQYTELQKKAQNYNDKLDRSVQVLNDHIVGIQSSVLNEMLMAPKVELGAYDAERETFDITAQDTANARSPFVFKGKVGIPLNTAKTLNRTAPGFSGVLHFINYPFGTGSEDVNLAMSKLQLSKDGQDLKTEGIFGEIERYKSIEGYNVWKVRADSILSGTLKSQGLDYAYAMGRAAAKDATAQADEKEGSGGLGWRGWTRIVVIPAAIALGTLGVIKNNDVKKKKDDADYYASQYENGRSAPGSMDQKTMDEYSQKHADSKKDSKDAGDLRNIFFGSAGGCAFVAILTFVF
jgi:hypothetical protein